jgi:hypothetical protein
MICFGLFPKRLSLSHDLDHEFGGLTLIDSSYFLCLFLIDFFFQFHLSILGLLRIEFHNLLFIRLYRSYDPGCEFGRLTRVDSSYFLGPFLIDFFQFYPSTLSLLKIKFCNLFLFIFYKVILNFYMH